MCENITNLSFIGAAGGEYEWRCQYKGSELENCQYTREGVSLEEILSYINCIDREKLSVLNMELWRIGDGSTCVVKKNQELYR